MDCVPILKHKSVRLHGKALSKLNTDIHKRDGDRCIIKSCRHFIDSREKFHHEPCGADKSDEIEKGVTLCQCCHYERHHGQRAAEVRAECKEYLKQLYEH